MKEFWTIIKSAFFAIGGCLGYFLGGSDGLLYALLTFVGIDYVTGVMCAVNDKELSSAVGFRGICRKILIFLLVGLGSILDEHILHQPGILRTAVIFFFLANEGLSILENSAHLGLKIPTALKEVLEQLHHRSEKSGDAELDPQGGEEELPVVEGEPMPDTGDNQMAYTGSHEAKE